MIHVSVTYIPIIFRHWRKHASIFIKFLVICIQLKYSGTQMNTHTQTHVYMLCEKLLVLRKKKNIYIHI